MNLQKSLTHTFERITTNNFIIIFFNSLDCIIVSRFHAVSD